ncbi:hypothetical protein CJ030_MR0G008892 [Morella rubra]|uniref:Uncharacterized protein n=1 Tax=Morella rubra TaxID=262757 RepID=A0A6A1UHF1_9ROSI|nr:hypothetical protein CJ030_MR0G008892 [Morella rubra]
MICTAYDSKNSPPASYYKCHDDEERLGGVRRRRRGSSRSRKKNKGHNPEDVSITHPEEAHVISGAVMGYHYICLHYTVASDFER